MSTKCYAAVRGSAIRVTSLDDRGRFGDLITSVASKGVASIRVNEVVESAKVETEKNPEEDRRLRFVRPATQIRSTVDIEFTSVDPALYTILLNAGVAGINVDTGGFGEGEFGSMGFGEASTSLSGQGLEANTRTPPVSFALEVWSKLAGRGCPPTPGFGGSAFGADAFGGEASGSVARQWGYTLFQHLRGGRISGFRFDRSNAVSFALLGAQSRRSREWGVGPYDLEGDFERMTSAVSRNNTFRQMLTYAQPPIPNGIETRYDVISNGDAANPMPDPSAPLVLSGGGATTSSYIISGGRA